MTPQPSPAPRRETGPEDDTDPPCSASRKQHKPFRFSCPEQSAPNAVAVKALRPLTRSGSARALPPTPTSTRPASTRKLAEPTKTTQRLVLTGPAPSDIPGAEMSSGSLLILVVV